VGFVQVGNIRVALTNTGVKGYVSAFHPMPLLLTLAEVHLQLVGQTEQHKGKLAALAQQKRRPDALLPAQHQVNVGIPTHLATADPVVRAAWQLRAPAGYGCLRRAAQKTFLMPWTLNHLCQRLEPPLRL